VRSQESESKEPEFEVLGTFRKKPIWRDILSFKDMIWDRTNMEYGGRVHNRPCFSILDDIQTEVFTIEFGSCFCLPTPVLRVLDKRESVVIIYPIGV
jgi:hypothetical protein